MGGKEKGEEDAAKEEPVVVIPIEASAPHRGDISVYFETTSRVEAERRVDISAKSSARCLSVIAEEGDTVTAGQVLAELEKDEARAAYTQSEVLVRQNETAYELAKLQHGQGLGPKVEMDNAYYTYEQSLATLETQRLQLENLTIRAPIDGVVTLREIQVGMLVSQNMRVYSLMDPSSFMLAISPPEKELPRLKIGQKAKVTIDSLRGREFDASIRRINPSVDPISGTVKVVLDFDTEVRDQLHESAFARVKLVMATLKGVLLVPKEAVLEEDGRTYVFVASRMPEDIAAKTAETPSSEGKEDDGSTLLTGEAEASVKEDIEAEAAEYPAPNYIAERVEIKVGLEDSQFIQVFAGLKDDDLLVTNGQHTLKSGATVRVTNTADEIGSRADLSADEALAAAQEQRESGGDSKDSVNVRVGRRH